MKLDEAKEKIKQWIYQKEPDCKIPHFELDDQFVRFGKKRKRFYIVGHIHNIKSDSAFIITVGDHYTGDKETFKSFEKKFEKKNPILIYQIYKNISHIEKKELSDLFANLDSAEDSQPYLVKKNIKAYEGVKILFNDLIIPAYDLETDFIVSYEKIFGDGNKKRHRFPKTNTYFPIGDMTKHIFISEGYATAATVHKVTGEYSVCTFGGAGLFNVAKHFSKKYPLYPITICSDRPNDDDLTFISNLKDKIIKDGLLNVSVIYPIFFKNIENQTDFNDLYNLDKKLCIEQLLHHKKHTNYVFILGQDEGRIFLFSNKTGIFETTHRVSKEELMLLASEKYWKKFSENKGLPYWPDIIKMIMYSCAEKEFSLSSLRFQGAYLDNNEIVINTHSRIIGKPSGKYRYLSYNKEPVFPNPLNYKLNFEKLIPFAKLLQKLNFRYDKDVYLLLSWIMLAPYFRTLELVPHLNITGNRGSGKTWIVENILKVMLAPFNPYCTYKGTTLPAFLRKIKNNFGICFLDEIENINIDVDYEGWMNVFRLSSTNTDPKIEKALSHSAGIVTYPCKIITVLSSITSIVKEDQDRPRFFELRIVSKDDNKNIDLFLKGIKSLDLYNLSLGLYNYFYVNFARFKSLYKDNMKSLLQDKLLTTHSARKISALMASASMLFDFNEKEYLKIYEEFIYEARLSDSDYGLDQIIIRIFNSYVDRRTETTVKQAFLNRDAVCIDILLNGGIKFWGNSFYIHQESDFIKNNVFKNISFDYKYKNWQSFLRNDKQIEMGRAKFSGDKKFTVFKIPVKLCPFTEHERLSLMR